MTPLLALSILFIYFGVLVAISIYTSKGADTNSFFIANKSVPWWLVAFGMIGTSLSGVTFISVPGLVGKNHFSYFQTVLGFTLGYYFIGTVLMPLYYKLNLISIYGYLKTRFGFWSYKTGSAFFLLSRTLGSAVRLFIAAQVLQLAIYDPLGIPFEVSVFFTVFLIWVYTFKGGVKTIVITDSLQTVFLITAVAMTIYLISSQLGYGFGYMTSAIFNSSLSETFYFDGGWSDSKNFFKQFISGAFIAIVMTCLDQNLMQKNLTCKNIKEAQKNMFSFTIVMVIVNLMFLSLGALMYIYSEKEGIQIPANSDELFPMLALKVFANPSMGFAGVLVGVTFLVGITAATYASSDSALTALTTAFCIDFMDIQSKDEAQKTRIKNRVHIGFSLIFIVVILIFKALNNTNVILAIYKIASYTYGPLLGLFFTGIYTKWEIKDKLTPIVCIVSPILTYILVMVIENYGGYKFGFENLLLNGAITILGLWLARKKAV